MGQIYTVVIAEDNDIQREGLHNFISGLVKTRAAVLSFDNGNDALDFIKKNKVDLLITDLHIPFINGPELAKAAKLISADTKIIFISAYSEFEYAMDALHIGVMEYLVKPIDTEKLQKILSSLLNLAPDNCTMADSISNTSEYVIKKLSPEEPAVPFSRLVQNCITIIEENYKNPDFSIDSSANILCVSKGYLSNCFSKETGVSLAKFLMCFRLMKAKELIENSNIKINAIANNTGFSDFSLFCKNFKAQFGYSPSAMRRNPLV